MPFSTALLTLPFAAVFFTGLPLLYVPKQTFALGTHVRGESFSLSDPFMAASFALETNLLYNSFRHAQSILPLIVVCQTSPNGETVRKLELERDSQGW